MTFPTMTESLNEVRTPRLLRIHSCRRSEGHRRRGEDPAPVGKRPTHGQGKQDVVWPVGHGCRLHTMFEIGIQGGNVLGLRIPIRGERHRWVERMTLRHSET